MNEVKIEGTLANKVGGVMNKTNMNFSRFTIKVESKLKDGKTSTLYLDCKAFATAADIVNAAEKGDTVKIVGSLSVEKQKDKSSNYTSDLLDTNGNKIYKTVITAGKVFIEKNTNTQVEAPF